jgi:penicillin-binding protein 1A
MAAAYATFAARGEYAEPYAISRILDAQGRIVYAHTPRTRMAFDAREVGVLNAALEGVVDHGTGTAAQIGRPVAGKTGTTQNFGDAWFVGFVPQLTTAVWVGYPQGDVPMSDVHGIAVAGGTFPARVFAAVMEKELADVPVQQLYTASPDSLFLHGFGSPPTQPAPGPTITTGSTTTSSTEPVPVPGPVVTEPTTTFDQRTTTTWTTSTTWTPPPSTTSPPTTTTSSPPTTSTTQAQPP